MAGGGAVAGFAPGPLGTPTDGVAAVLATAAAGRAPPAALGAAAGDAGATVAAGAAVMSDGAAPGAAGGGGVGPASPPPATVAGAAAGAGWDWAFDDACFVVPPEQAAPTRAKVTTSATRVEFLPQDMRHLRARAMCLHTPSETERVSREFDHRLAATFSVLAGHRWHSWANSIGSLCSPRSREPLTRRPSYFLTTAIFI